MRLPGYLGHQQKGCVRVQKGVYRNIEHISSLLKLLLSVQMQPLPWALL